MKLYLDKFRSNSRLQSLANSHSRYFSILCISYIQTETTNQNIEFKVQSKPDFFLFIFFIFKVNGLTE